MKVFLLWCSSLLFAIGFLILLLLVSCGVNKDKAIETLTSMGYKDVKIGGTVFDDCGHDEVYASKFSATAPNGLKVYGIVCDTTWMGRGMTIKVNNLLLSELNNLNSHLDNFNLPRVKP